MARTTVVKVFETRRKFIWPEAQLNFWLIVMLAAAGTITGVFTYFMTVQHQVRAGQIWYGNQSIGFPPMLSPPYAANVLPWLFPFSIAVGSLTLLFLAIMLGLIAQRQLLPGIVMLGCFILFVLFMTGLVETSIQLYGPTGSVNYYCNLYHPSSGFQQGQGQATLAYLETLGICNDWKAVFSFYIVGTVFLIWMMVMAWQVQNDTFD